MTNFIAPLWRSWLGCALLLLSSMTTTMAQTGVSTPVASQNGFILKKTTTNTAIQTGVNFSYNIDFTIPAGATNVTITDVLPMPLTYQAITFTAPCGGAPTVVTPAIGANGTVSFTFPSVPLGCTGSISITVQLPNGTTCNGAVVRNQACLTGKIGPVGAQFCTEFVSTTAQAVNPWHINKYLLPSSTTPSCSNSVTNDTANYRFCVWKNVGTTGQLNLLNPTVTDVLPAGAVIVSSSCPYTVATVGTQQTVTWNLGSVLLATSAYNQVCCDFKVYYPTSSFPSGTTISNTATLSGGLGSPTPQPCGTFTQASNTTSYQVTTVPKSQLYKWVSTTGQPGCGGQYTLYVCNDGGVTLSTFTLKDTLPTTLTGYTVTSSTPNVSVAIVGGTLTATSTTSLPSGGYVYITLNFTIPLTATVGSTITNCVTLTSPQLPNPVKACASFVVTAPLPKACVWKEVCSKQASYLPNSTFRYRLRVQNIGGLAMTGTTVTDLLSPYLTYVGNPTFYTANTWNIPCSSPALPSGATTWTGVTFSQTGQTLTWNLPSIAAVCQSLFYTGCGQYGTSSVPYYYIEFDVKVNADAPIGVVPNTFTINGGNLPVAETSNTDYVNIVGSAGYNLVKTITLPTTTTVAPNSLLTYRLQFNAIGTAALRHVAMADLLPRNNGAADRRLLTACASRGSNFGLTYHSTVGAWVGVPSATSFTEGSENLNSADVNLTNITIPGVSGPYFGTSCGAFTTVVWTNGAINTIPVGKKNVGYYFGSQAVPSGSYARTEFKTQVPATATNGQVACNSFAANAAKRYLINSVTLQDIAMTEQESPNVCITVKLDTIVHQDTCNDKLIQPIINNLCCEYKATLQNLSGSPIMQILWTATSGTVQSANTTGCLSTVSVNSPTTGTITFSSPCALNPQLTFNSTGNIITNLVAITLTIIHQNGDTCYVRFEYKCKKDIAERCDSVSVKPFVYPALDASGRTFTVHNLKIPNGPICWIDIKVGTLVGTTFTQLPWWLGGGMVLPNALAPNSTALFQSIGGKYTRLPSNQPNVNVPSAQNVSFNLGVDYTYINTGNVVVRLVVHHCDGDSCSYEIKWKAPVTHCPTCPILDATTYTERIFAKQIALKGNGDRRPVKYVAFKIPTNSEADIFATSAATLDTEGASARTSANLKAAGMSAKTALFEFVTPVVLGQNERSPLINMVFVKALPNLSYTLFDENGDEIFTQSVQLTTNIIGTPQNVDGLKAKVFPNPAQNEAFVQYELPQASDVKVDLFNINGQFIRSLDNTRHESGSYQTRFTTEGVAKGAYFVRIVSNGSTKSLPLMIQ